MSSSSASPPPKRQRILVTGGAGFIGSHLTERLLADGHSVIVVDDLSTGLEDNLRAVRDHPGLEFVHSRLSACAELSTLIAGAGFIYHLAAAVGVDLVVRQPVRVLETNLHETEVLLNAAAEHQVPCLLASTSEVYGKSQRECFSEEDDLLIGPPTHSRWSYACSKLMDEFLTLAYHGDRKLPVIIARLFNTVGPRQRGDYGMVLPRFIDAALQNAPLKVFGDGKQTRCFCHVADTVEALVRLEQTPSAYGEIYNVGNTEEIAINDLACRVIDRIGSGSIEHVSYDDAYAPGFEDITRRRPNIDKLKQATGFCPQRSLHAIIESILDTKKAP